MTDIIRLGEYEAPEFDEKIANIECWYDRHSKLWIIQKLNSDGFQVGDAIIVHGKKTAMNKKKELENEFGLS